MKTPRIPLCLLSILSCILFHDCYRIIDPKIQSRDFFTPFKKKEIVQCYTTDRAFITGVSIRHESCAKENGMVGVKIWCSGRTSVEVVKSTKIFPDTDPELVWTGMQKCSHGGVVEEFRVYYKILPCRAIRLISLDLKCSTNDVLMGDKELKANGNITVTPWAKCPSGTSANGLLIIFDDRRITMVQLACQ